MVALITMQVILYLLVTLLGLRTSLSLYRYRWRSLPVKSGEMPTVSLLIPSRNETHAITRALSNALALDYPKLEIIVLDDESGDNTSEKIRSFAQEGVRFLGGKPLPGGWIGKNWACHQLSEQASGKYLVYCDVDVHLGSKTLTRLIRLLEQQNIDCVSVLPKLLTDSRAGSIVAPLMPWWMLTVCPLIRRLPPVFGGFIIFNTASYRQHGGYSRYTQETMPELSLARDFAKRRNYRFFYSSQALLLRMLKRSSSTHETRVRYFWPLYKYSPVFMILHIALLILPIILLSQPLLFITALVFFALAIRLGQSDWFLAVLFWPLACIFELLLVVVSIFKNVQGKVTWKSRRIS